MGGFPTVSNWRYFMFKKALFAIAATLVVTSASAGFVTIDNFAVVQPVGAPGVQVQDPSNSASPMTHTQSSGLGTYVMSRTLTVARVDGNGVAGASIHDNFLDMNTAQGTDSTVRAAWSVNSANVISAIGGSHFWAIFTVLPGGDPGSTNSTTAKYSGSTRVQTVTAGPSYIWFDLGGSPNPIDVTFSLFDGADLRISSLGVYSDCSASDPGKAFDGSGTNLPAGISTSANGNPTRCGGSVPVPGSVALLGLGLLGLAGLRRKA
jgi:PEP-CTERM motif